MKKYNVLTGAVIVSRPVWIRTQIDFIGKISVVEFNFSFLRQSVLRYRLECLLDVDCLFCARFKVRNIVLTLTPALSSFCRHLDETKGICKTTAVSITLNNKNELTARFSRSSLLPITTNGKFSGSRGDACIKNSSRHESNDLNVFGAVTS